MNEIKIDDSRLDLPLRPLRVGRLSSAVLALRGVPRDVAAVSVRVGRTADPGTGEARPDLSAAADRRDGGRWGCYLSPFHFPDAADGLEYHVVGADENGNARWLGTGTLDVLDRPGGGDAAAPEIVPADTYLRNPSTGLYHRLTAVLNEDGELTVQLDEEGIER